MNGLCCSLKMNINTTIECKFKNNQKNPSYSLTSVPSQRSARSLNQNKLYEEVCFNSLFFSKSLKYKWIEEHCYVVQKKKYFANYKSSKLILIHIKNNAKKR